MIATAPPQQLATVEGQRMTVSFHAGQTEAWQATERIVAVIAGSQGGKTSFGPHWLRREMEEQGTGDYLVVTPTTPLLRLKALPEFLALFRDRLHLGVWKAADRVFLCEDGSRVIFGSATNPDSLESATAKAAWLDECGQDRFSLSAYEAVRRRLALSQGRMLLTTTPYNMGWLYTHIYKPAEAGDRSIRVISFTSLMNPLFPRAEYEDARRRLAPWKFAMMHRGVFTRPAGLIYPDFKDTLREQGGHLERAFTIPPEWPHYGSFDFGAVNRARLLAAEDPGTGRLIVYSELLTGDRSTEEAAEGATEAEQEAARLATTAEQAAAAKGAILGTNFQAWWGGSPSEQQPRLDFTSFGVPIQPPPVGDVESGIDAVTEYLRTRRLGVFEGLDFLIDEFARYKRKVDPESGDVFPQIVDKAQFHLLDALRYLVLGHKHTVPIVAPLGIRKGEEEWTGWGFSTNGGATAPPELLG